MIKTKRKRKNKHWSSTTIQRTVFLFFFCKIKIRSPFGHAWMFNDNIKSPESCSHSWLGKKTKHKSEHNQERGAIALKVL